MYKKFLPLFILLSISLVSYSQGGSNIQYVKPTDLNATHLDKPVQFDFYNRSFRGLYLDTVLVAVKDKSIKFLEHRTDNGHYNWFSQQYVQSIDSIGGYRLRLTHSTINGLTRDEILVTNYFNLFNSENHPLFETPFTDTNSYRRKSIAEVLILVP